VEAVNLLAGIGDDAEGIAIRQLVIPLLEHKNAEVRLTALGILRSKGEAAERLLPPLMTLLGSPDPLVRAGAVRLLGIIGDDAEGIVPIIGKALSDDNAAVRTEAVEALKQITRRRGAR
jgi:HEAT repeat protein